MSRAKTMLAACTALGILAVGTSALAQPGAYAAEAAEAPEPPPGPPPTAQPEPPEYKWGIGLRTTSMSIVNAADENGDNAHDAMELDGAGIHVRYQLADNWRAELTLEGASTSANQDDQGFERESSMASLSLQYIFNPYSRWNWYVLGGVGAVESKITTDTPNGSFEETFEERHLQFGLGLERRFTRISIGAEIRGAGLERDDKEADGINYAGIDGPVPMESSAALFNLHGTYYF